MLYNRIVVRRIVLNQRIINDKNKIVNRFITTNKMSLQRDSPVDGVLASTRDRYRGITVDTNLTKINEQQFPELLKS